MKIVSGLNIDFIEVMDFKDAKDREKEESGSKDFVHLTVRVDSRMHKSLKLISLKEKVHTKYIITALLEKFVEQYSESKVVDSKAELAGNKE